VNPAVEPDEVASSFGDFKPMPIDAEALGSRNAEAIDLLAEAEYR
jgi:iron(III) transport system substrate-binding protein